MCMCGAGPCESSSRYPTLTAKMGTRHRAATASANTDLPQPGGPCSNTPRGACSWSDMRAHARRGNNHSRIPVTQRPVMGPCTFDTKCCKCMCMQRRQGNLSPGAICCLSECATRTPNASSRPGCRMGHTTLRCRRAFTASYPTTSPHASPLQPPPGQGWDFTWAGIPYAPPPLFLVQVHPSNPVQKHPSIHPPTFSENARDREQHTPNLQETWMTGVLSLQCLLQQT